MAWTRRWVQSQIIRRQQHWGLTGSPCETKQSTSCSTKEAREEYLAAALVRNISAKLGHGEDFPSYAHVHNCTPPENDCMRMAASSDTDDKGHPDRLSEVLWALCNHIQRLHQSNLHYVESGKRPKKKKGTGLGNCTKERATRLLYNCYISTAKCKVFTNIGKHSEKEQK